MVNQVISIFKMKNSSALTTEVAVAYGVNEKVVRDRWKGRTWAKETFHLDKSRSLQIEKVGRTIGCSDSRPRMIRMAKLRETDAKIKQKTIDDELFDWEQNVCSEDIDATSLQISMVDWASQQSK